MPAPVKTRKSVGAKSREEIERVFNEVGADQLKEWILDLATGCKGDKKKKIAARAPNPGRAAELMLGLAEYCAPKLARVEQTGEDGGPLRVIVHTVASPKKAAQPEEGT